MSDLLHDVDEMLRQEKLLRFWKTYGNALITGVLMVILAVAIHAGYTAWFAAQSERHTAAWGAAVAASGEDMAALQKFAQDQAGGNVGALAALQVAQKQIAKGDRAAATATVLAVRNEAGVSPDLRDLATLWWVRLVADDPAHRPEDLRAALKPLMHDDARPFAFPARIEDAAILAHRMNDYAGAIKILDPMVNNPALPYTLSERARAMVDVYRARTGEK